MLTPITRPTPPRGKRIPIGAPRSTKTTHAAASANFFWISTEYRLILTSESCTRAVMASICAAELSRYAGLANGLGTPVGASKPRPCGAAGARCCCMAAAAVVGAIPLLDGTPMPCAIPLLGGYLGTAAPLDGGARKPCIGRTPLDGGADATAVALGFFASAAGVDGVVVGIAAGVAAATDAPFAPIAAIGAFGAATVVSVSAIDALPKIGIASLQYSPPAVSRTFGFGAFTGGSCSPVAR